MLRAYFSPRVFARWRVYDQAMVNFLYLAGLEGQAVEAGGLLVGLGVDIGDVPVRLLQARFVR